MTDPKSKHEDLRRAPSPLSILYRYLDLFASDLLPLLPQLHRGATDYDDPRTPDWLAWKPNGDLERAVRRRVLESTKHGVWVFLSEPAEKKAVERKAAEKNAPKKKRKKRGDDSDDEREARVISDDGWCVLEWLVALWSTSPGTLLQQLHQPASVKLQYDDAGVVLAAVRAAFLPTDSPTPLSVLPQRRETAAKLLSFVIDLARPPKAPFHSQSLVLSLVTLFRVSAAQLPALSRAITDWNARAHILAVVLEDAAGVRKQREAARRSNVASRSTSRAPSVGIRGTRMTAPRSRSVTSVAEDVPGMMSLATPFQAPAVDYALNLLALDGDDRSPVLAAELVSLLVAHAPKDDAWLRLNDEFIGAHDGVLGRVLIMARRKADAACGRVSNVGVKVVFAVPDEPMDVDETQETLPLTRSQLAKFEAEESQSRAGLLSSGGSSPLTSLPDDGGDGDDEDEDDADELQPPAETLPLSNAQRAQLEDMESDEEEEEDSQLPAETLPLTKTRRAQFAAEDDLESAEESHPGGGAAMESDGEESQLPAETLPLTVAQRAQFADDLSDEESLTPAPAETRQTSLDDSAREASVSDIIGNALSPMGSDEGEESQLPAETQPLTRSQRALYDDEESQLH